MCIRDRAGGRNCVGVAICRCGIASPFTTRLKSFAMRSGRSLESHIGARRRAIEIFGPIELGFRIARSAESVREKQKKWVVPVVPRAAGGLRLGRYCAAAPPPAEKRTYEACLSSYPAHKMGAKQPWRGSSPTDEPSDNALCEQERAVFVSKNALLRSARIVNTTSASSPRGTPQA